MSVIIFIVVLLLLVLVHEFGHFIVAKKAGIRVDEFAFGFPPKLWSIKKGETTYVLNALPLGGYVKIYGENPNEVKAEDGNRAQAEPSLYDDSRSFVAQPQIVQGLVIVAGIVFNLLFAWILFSAAFMIGVPAPVDDEGGYPIQNPQLIITDVADKSPAALAGLRSGDVLKTLSDGAESVDVTTNPDAVIAFVSPREGKSILFTYERKGAIEQANITPVSGIVPDAAAIGIYMDAVGTLRLPPHTALWVGLQKTYEFTVMTVVGTARFIKDSVVGDSDFSQVTGPVGIVRAVGDAAGIGFTNVMLFTAVISINLAVINIIPFPALDGGRLLFIMIEAVARRPIKPVVANAFNVVGFALLLLLMIAVTYHDLIKLFAK